MSEKRKSKRHARRLKVRFGDAGSEAFPYSGLTHDVSATGLFVTSSHVPRPGTRLHLEVFLPGEHPLFVEGVVSRLVLVPPELRSIRQQGFGVRYLQGGELLHELVPRITKAANDDDPFTLVFTDREAWQHMLHSELKRGGVFLWSPKPVAPASSVTVTFDLRFIERRLSFIARVVHATNGEDGRHGVALMFVDAGGAAMALLQTLSAA